MRVPSDYGPGYERARALSPRIADNYIAHTVLGDPEADALIADLSDLSGREIARHIRAAMDRDEKALRDAPGSLVTFYESMETPPGWVDLDSFIPGIRMFHRNSRLVLGAFVGGVLVEGFATNISKSFFLTGKLRDQGVRRLRQNNRHMIEIFMPGGLERGSDGWKLSVRIRLIHARVRQLIRQSGEWDEEAWGAPISAAHVGFSITAFSARLLMHLRSLGAAFNDEERASFMSVWRYSGYLMGIPESILFEREADAHELFRVGSMCEPSGSDESIAMANALINSAPLVIGVDDPVERRRLARYVFTVSRAIIGNPLADMLRYPPGRSLGVLTLFRLQTRIDRLIGRLLHRRTVSGNFTQFTSLLEASMFDEAGIPYRLPDHVYAEESSRW